MTGLIVVLTGIVIVGIRIARRARSSTGDTGRTGGSSVLELSRGRTR